MTSIALFVGAGGLSEGPRQTAFKSLYANELEKVYARIYALNHPATWVENRDIRQEEADKVCYQLGPQRRQLDLIAGGPPCQGLSINAPKRCQSDCQNHLFRQYLRVVAKFQPKAVLIENVPGLVSFTGGATLAEIMQALEELSY